MKAYLGVFQKFMDFNEERMNLLEFNSIEELDKYTQKFNNSGEIKKDFETDIQEFILQNRFSKSYKETKSGKPILYLSAYVIYNGRLRFIPVLYKGYTVTRNKKAKNITTSLLNNDNFEKFIEKYSYLLGDSHYIKDLIYSYKKRKQESVKKLIINELISRISTAKGDERYYFFRTLMELCNLIEVKIDTKYGSIKNINILNEQTRLVKDRIAEDCSDERFIKFIVEENYEELFNNYDLDEILMYSSDGDNPLGVRRK